MASEPIEDRLGAAGLPPLPRTAWIEVDLAAIRSNLAAIRRAAGPDVRVEPVVKADAYGHGAVPVALALEAAGADGFGVATFDEALELRASGVRAPIVCLYPVPPALAGEAARRRIAVAAGGGVVLERLVAGLGAARARVARLPVLDVHLELETGLGRGGVLPDEVGTAAARIRSTPGMRLAGVWSHLAAPDDPRVTEAQARAFEAAREAARESVDRPSSAVPGRRVRARRARADVPGRHIAASGGLLAGGVELRDAIRPGLAIYGLVPDALPIADDRRAAADALRPALRLLARPVRVADLPAGHGVSYGPSFVTSRPSRIATLPIGYADGWWRSRSDAAVALVRGRRVPLVGRVAMDAVMADVTDVPGPPITPDDEFVLIGGQGDAAIGVAQLATAGTTISWEVVASLSRRLPRVYHSAGVPEGVRTLAGWRAEWHGSSSGTATSAISKSTRS